MTNGKRLTMSQWIRLAAGRLPVGVQLPGEAEPTPPWPSANAGNGTGAPPVRAMTAAQRFNLAIRRAAGKG